MAHRNNLPYRKPDGRGHPNPALKRLARAVQSPCPPLSLVQGASFRCPAVPKDASCSGQPVQPVSSTCKTAIASLCDRHHKQRSQCSLRSSHCNGPPRPAQAGAFPAPAADPAPLPTTRRISGPLPGDSRRATLPDNAVYARRGRCRSGCGTPGALRDRHSLSSCHPGLAHSGKTGIQRDRSRRWLTPGSLDPRLRGDDRMRGCGARAIRTTPPHIP